MLNFTKPVLLASIIILLVFKLYNLNNINFDIDLLDKQLTPIKKYIKPNSSIGFYSTAGYGGLYMAIEYVMAPDIIINNLNLDTLLVIKKKGSILQHLEHYHPIIQNEDGDRSVSLMTKIK